jgi:aldehyde dehydrogenase (NAD+)
MKVPFLDGELFNPAQPITCGAWIEGKQVFTGQWLEVENPFTGEICGRVAHVDTAMADTAIRNASQVRLKLPRAERSAILSRMAERLVEDREAVAHLISMESGLCLADTRYEVGRALAVLRLASIAALEDDSRVFPCDVVEGGPGRRIYTQRQPTGLIGAITPFNHPLNQVVHKVAPAIAANAPGVLKPSEKTPLSAYYFAALTQACGWPDGALTVINGAREEIGPLLVAHPETKVITFTGSSAVGKSIAQQAGYKKTVLELGGSSVLIVMDDFDPAEAAKIAAAGIFVNSGQRCTNIRRILVQRPVKAAFEQALLAEAAAWAFGDPLEENHKMGALVDAAAARVIHDRVEATLNEGARLLHGHKLSGAVYGPTVVTDVYNHFTLARYETFGPVASILTFDTLDEAIAIANDTAYGLSGAVATHRWDTMQRVITELDTGTVNVNTTPGFRLEWSPFGGIKDSGLGVKEGVIEAMKAYTYVKSYSLPWEQP